MTPETVLEVGNQAMWIAILMAGPLLLVALVVGVVIGMVQAATQIQEMTLSFIPKLIGVVGVLVVAGPWMLTVMVDWFRTLILDIPLLVVGGA
jgi:flagellar biosynthetic protein FliQ